MFEKILDYIFPKTCGLCGKINKENLCNKCKVRINKLVVGKLHIKYINSDFIKIMYLFKYEGELRNILLSYKFKEKNYLYEFFVKIILKNEKVCQFFEKYDIIIPVPIHKKKLKARGYNQCDLIAKKIAKNCTNMKYKNNILIKTKNNSRQSSLKLEERKNNVQNVYTINNLIEAKKEFQNKKILLFDDIYTTGNTVKECVKNLQKLNPNKIGIFTIFRD